MSEKVRRLYLVFGDQLDHQSPFFDEIDPDRDRLWMAEIAEEATHVWCHKLRLAFFFSAMRHFREYLTSGGYTVQYHELGKTSSDDIGTNFSEVLRHDLARMEVEELVAVEPGDHRVREALEIFAKEKKVKLRWLDDTHFYLPLDAFNDWAADRKSFLLEHFYRMMRKRSGILMTPKGKPEGGGWNFDKDNRRAFGKKGPPSLPVFGDYPADALTREVVALINSRFPEHPGQLDAFSLPVTREAGLEELDRFIEERLHGFGEYEDALWSGEKLIYHSRLSALLNVKLLNPREVVDRVIKAYKEGRAPLNSVEGYVRQILGWREFVRGIYHFFGPDYLSKNALGAKADLPTFFWDGKTDMACVKDTMENVLENGYAHHIQRLMVLGQFSLLWGADPFKFHEWHMAMYLDAIDWASAPNTIGMSQFGDGGIVATKPYCASGNYIKKMSNHCSECRYRPELASGEQACPFTTLYYSFLDRHRERFADNRRMTFQLKNLERKSTEELAQIRARETELRAKWGGQEESDA